jgi:hypothetical protein
MIDPRSTAIFEDRECNQAQSERIAVELSFRLHLSMCSGAAFSIMLSLLVAACAGAPPFSFAATQRSSA